MEKAVPTARKIVIARGTIAMVILVLGEPTLWRRQPAIAADPRLHHLHQTLKQR